MQLAVVEAVVLVESVGRQLVVVVSSLGRYLVVASVGLLVVASSLEVWPSQLLLPLVQHVEALGALCWPSPSHLQPLVVSSLRECPLEAWLRVKRPHEGGCQGVGHWVGLGACLSSM